MFADSHSARDEALALGLGEPMSRVELCRRIQALVELEREQDRLLYERLGPELTGTACRRRGCARSCIAHSALCRAHHFELVRGRACPF